MVIPLNFPGGAAANVHESIQLIETDMAFSGTTRNITISSVVAANSALYLMAAPAGNGASKDMCRVELTSSTNLRLTKGSSSAGTPIMKIQVIEYNPDVIESIQTATFSGVASSDIQNASITSVDTSKTIVFSNGISTTETTIRIAPTLAWLTSSTNCQIFVRTSGSPTVTGKATIVEFK